MTKVRRALWVTAESPDRNLGGGHIREAYLLDALARQLPTDLLLVGRLEDQRTREVLGSVTELPLPAPERAPSSRWHAWERELYRGLLEPQPVEVAQNRRLRAGLTPALRDVAGYDIVCVEQSWLGPLLPRSRSNAWILGLHNLASRRAAHELALPGPARRRWVAARQLQKAKRFERWAAGAYDAVVVASDEDAACLGAGIVVPNGVDLRRFQPSPLPSQPRLFFSGTLSWGPNVDGIRWFCAEILPLVRERIPTVALEIVGRSPTPAVRALAAVPGVSFHEDVADILPYLCASRVAILPLRIGSGTRLKALEAMAVGRPMVGTTIGLEGLGIKDRESAFVADDPRTAAAAVIRLLQDEDAAQRMAAAARQLVQTRFGWEQVGAGYVQGLLEIADRRLSRPESSGTRG